MDNLNLDKKKSDKINIILNSLSNEHKFFNKNFEIEKNNFSREYFKSKFDKFDDEQINFLLKVNRVKYKPLVETFNIKYKKVTLYF
tara:strand:- start:3159 stop:3416 length:258 start_codon:yes stop_codon:yes gene_type:complete